MRIISGKYKGRQLHPPKNLPVRPTTDFAKEGLFNVLNNQIDWEEQDALDLFSGTGNISFELISRGCKEVVCVDNNPTCLAFIKKTSEEWKINTMRTVKSDVFIYLKSCKKQFSFIFADPPYEMEGIERLPLVVMEKQVLRPRGCLIIEHSNRTQLSELPGFVEQRTYGNVNFSFFNP